MKKFTTFETQLGESVVLTDRAKLSLYKKSQNSGYSIDILEEVYRRGYSIWNESFGGSPDSFAFDRVNSFVSGGFAAILDEDLKKACWKGYEAVGMKTKNGKKVPNCVPVKEELNKKVMTPEQIANKHGVSVESINNALKRGIEVEKEHTTHATEARRIALAHLGEKPDYYKKLDKAGLEENAEAHSKDFRKPSSRFIGSNELTDVYKKQTPGQIIKNVVRESIQEENDGFPRNWQKKPPGNSFEVHDDKGNLKGHYFHYTGSITSRRPIKGGYSQKKHSSVEDAISHLKSTPLGQKPVLEAAATYVPPTYQPPAEMQAQKAPQRQLRTNINVRDVAPRAERSGTGTARLGQSGAGQSSWNVKPEVKTRLPARGSMGVSTGPMKPTNVSGGTSFSKGSFDVGKRMAGAKQTSDIVKGLTTAGREAAAKAGPAVARGLSGPVGAVVGAAAPELGKAMKQSHETGHKSFVQHSGGGEAASKVMSRMKEPSQGRSISNYEKDVLTPKTYEKPKNMVSVPTPPSRPEYMSRGQAFQAARSEVGGAGGKFSYGGKEYQTNVAGEKYTSKPKLTSVRDESESGGKTLKKIKEAIAEATYKGKKVPLNKPMKGDVKKSKVYVDPDGDGKAQKVNFGDKNMSIKKDQPARKRSYCARSGGQGNLNDKTSANYWSRRAWNCEETEVNESKQLQGYHDILTSHGYHQKDNPDRFSGTTYHHPKGNMVHIYTDPMRFSGHKAKILKTREEVSSPNALHNKLKKIHGLKEEISVPAGTTGKRETVSTPMVGVRMASGKIEKHPPGKNGSSGGGDE